MRRSNLRRRLDLWLSLRRHEKYMARRRAAGMATPHRPTIAQMDEMAKQDGGMPWASQLISTRVKSYTGWPT